MRPRMMVDIQQPAAEEGFAVRVGCQREGVQCANVHWHASCVCVCCVIVCTAERIRPAFGSQDHQRRRSQGVGSTARGHNCCRKLKPVRGHPTASIPLCAACLLAAHLPATVWVFETVTQRTCAQIRTSVVGTPLNGCRVITSSRGVADRTTRAPPYVWMHKPTPHSAHTH